MRHSNRLNMGIHRTIINKKYKLIASTEPRISKLLLAINHLDNTLVKKPRIQIEHQLTDLQKFEKGLKKQISLFKYGTIN